MNKPCFLQWIQGFFIATKIMLEYNCTGQLNINDLTPRRDDMDMVANSQRSH